MPELPEVETIRAQLAPRLEGRTLARVEILDPRLTRPARSVRGGGGARGRSRRRGRAPREVPAGAARERVRAPRPPPDDRQLRLAPTTHERAVLELDDGRGLHIATSAGSGPGSFSRMPSWSRIWRRRTAPSRSAALHVRAGSQRSSPARRAPLKAVLLDQRVVAGLGNIYADEALWRARLNPLRPAQTRSEEEALGSCRAIRAALRRGIAAPGLDPERLPQARRRVRLDAGGVPRLRPGGRAVPALSHDYREDARRRARHVVLPALPAALRSVGVRSSASRLRPSGLDGAG